MQKPLAFQGFGWSGRWESNPRHSAWEADVLPLNYARAGSDLQRLPRLPSSPNKTLGHGCAVAGDSRPRSRRRRRESSRRSFPGRTALVSPPETDGFPQRAAPPASPPLPRLVPFGRRWIDGQEQLLRRQPAGRDPLLVRVARHTLDHGPVAVKAVPPVIAPITASVSRRCSPCQGSMAWS